MAIISLLWYTGHQTYILVASVCTCFCLTQSIFRCLTPLQLLQLFVMNCSCDQIQIVVANGVDPFEQLLFRSNVNES